MSHPQIDEARVVDLYLARRLEPDDEARFEDHLFTCTRCLEDVEAGEELRRGLRDVAVDEMTRMQAGIRLGVLSRLGARLRGHGPLAALAVAVVALAAFAGWQQVALDRQERDIERLGLGRPVAVPMVSLGTVRAADTVDIVHLGDAPLILFSLEPPGSPSSRYTVELYAGDELLWRTADLEPSLDGTLMLTVPATWLPPGDYRLRIDEERAPSAAVATGSARTVDLRFRTTARAGDGSE